MPGSGGSVARGSRLRTGRLARIGGKEVVQLLRVQAERSGDQTEPVGGDTAVGGFDLRDRGIGNAGGVGQILPAHAELLAPIAENAGELVAAGLPATTRRPSHFPAPS